MESVYTQVFTNSEHSSLSRAITIEFCGVVAKGSLHTHVELQLGSTIRLGWFADLFIKIMRDSTPVPSQGVSQSAAHMPLCLAVPMERNIK